MTSPAADEYRATFTSTTGGVMTEEIGAITGELELFCRSEADGVHVMVRYAGTSDWHTVTGGPVRLEDGGAGASERILHHLTTPGPVVSGNEKPVTLEGFAGT